jgi:predicted 3-demethylubiquinone-9 3-methyltransferase (glyoxalase superfamily)
MQKITPFLWFDHQAVEAATFYTSIFKNSKITEITHYPDGAPLPAGTVMSVSFELDGTKLMALNGGPFAPFTEAISLYISTTGQEEIDYLWEKLSGEGGEPGRCGWLKDKYGVSWQVVPGNMRELIGGAGDADASGRVMRTMMKMNKIVISELQAAAAAPAPASE